MTLSRPKSYNVHSLNTPAVASEDLSTLSRLAGADVTAPLEIHGGRNSRVLRFSAGGKSLIAKFYYRGAGDGRDRFSAETAALRFLAENGSLFAPRLIAADEKAGCAVLEDLGGRKLTGREIGKTEIGQAVDFTAELHAFKGKPGADRLPQASEACFSLRALTEHLASRLSRLRAAEDAGLDRYLRDELSPAVSKAASWAEALVPAGRELAPSERTLSQSDFGFHNALLCAGGRLRFVDFEYFGWDDPAKMISDFLLQPVEGLSAEARSDFREGALARFGQAGLGDRVTAVYPLYGLKWALIMLNGFLAEHGARRGFAKVSETPAEQIEKSRRMLARMNTEHRGFAA